MPNNSTKHTIVYIEDGDWRHTLTPAFNNGFGDNVEVDDRGNFQQLFQELEKGDLATAYILDNEIVGEDKYGAEIAQIIHQKAKELGKQVLVITMLCSAPKQVKKKYGASLAEKDIPILNKHAHAALCGFYIGQCLQEGVMTFDSWLMKEGITLLESNAETQSVQSGIMLEMEMGEAGGFYLKPRSFISEHRKEITEYMRPRDIVTMNEIFPTRSGQEVK